MRAGPSSSQPKTAGADATGTARLAHLRLFYRKETA